MKWTFRLAAGFSGGCGVATTAADSAFFELSWSFCWLCCSASSFAGSVSDESTSSCLLGASSTFSTSFDCSGAFSTAELSGNSVLFSVTAMLSSWLLGCWLAGCSAANWSSGGEGVMARPVIMSTRDTRRTMAALFFLRIRLIIEKTKNGAAKKNKKMPTPALSISRVKR